MYFNKQSAAFIWKLGESVITCLCKDIGRIISQRTTKNDTERHEDLSQNLLPAIPQVEHEV